MKHVVALLMGLLLAGARPAVRDAPTRRAVVQSDTILRLTNVARERAGVVPLTLDSGLTAVAQAHARDMAENTYFSHLSPDGRTMVRLRDAGIPFTAAAENIAGDASAASAVESWIRSEAHRQNLLNPVFRRVGVGIHRTPTSQYTCYVQVFAN